MNLHLQMYEKNKNSNSNYHPADGPVFIHQNHPVRKIKTLVGYNNLNIRG
jgi:hypothetical protein